MTFGPITVNRPGASATVGIMGPIGITGAPGTPGTPGQQGPAVFTPISAWSSGITYSPGSATSPASYVSEGGSSYACTTLHTSGVFATDLALGLWEPVALMGLQGNPGTPGSTWYAGSGAPNTLVGINGDYFFRTDTSDIFQKLSGTWTLIANIKGAAGAMIQSGTGTPATALGNNSDFYLDLTPSAPRLFGPKASGAWPSSGISLLGAGTGSMNPSGTFVVGHIIVAGSTDGKTATDSGIAASSLATAASVAALPSSATPAMDGTGSAGSASTLSRSDHVHPTDASRASVGALAFAFCAGIAF